MTVYRFGRGSGPLRNMLIAAMAVLMLVLSPIGDGRAWAQDGIEQLFGVANIQGTTGNGRLTVGVSRDGDVSVLAWPSPTYYDHLHYLAQNGPDARQQPLAGALEGMGAYGGLAVELQGPPGLTTSFFHDPEWTRSVTYTDVDTSVVQSTMTHAGWGITVEQFDMVLPGTDTFIRRYRVVRDAQSPVQAAWLIGYSNLTPSQSRVPEVPVANFVLDRLHDFLAVWRSDLDAIVHFYPSGTGVYDQLGDLLSPPQRDFGVLGAEMTTDPVDTNAIQTIAQSLDEHYPSGVYAVLASDPAPDQFQVGADTTDTCTALETWVDNVVVAAESGATEFGAIVDAADLARCGESRPLLDVVEAEGWQVVPEDALTDARDGQLNGSVLAGGQVNTALRVPLQFAQDEAEATLYYAFGETSQAAEGALSSARTQTAAQWQAEIEEADRDWVAGLRMPDTANQDLLNFCIRVFLNIRVGTDAGSGAIVASISRQPSYHLDWPRDGAFFNVALDLAGENELVTRRMDYYSEHIRMDAVMPTPLVDVPVPGWPSCPSCQEFPANSWEMNYYSDGMIGGNTRLEIDNTALLVWAYVYHAGHLDEPERTEYMTRVWPTVERATNWLADWRDPETGLTWPANEDDNFEYTQGLQAAGTTFGALRAAAMMAKALGEDEISERWALRAGELRSAALQHLYREDMGFLNKLDSTERSKGGPSDWIAWPNHLLSWDDPRIREQLEYNLQDKLMQVRGEGPGAGYITKNAVSVGLVFEDGATRDGAIEIAETLADTVANQDGYYLGEVFLNRDTDNDGMTDTRVNAVATPHLWAATLVYLSAMAYHHPDEFDAYMNVLPAVEIPDVDAPLMMDEGMEVAEGDASADVDTADMSVLDGDNKLDPADISTADGGGDDGCGCSLQRRSRLSFVGWLLAAGLAWVLRRRRRD